MNPARRTADARGAGSRLVMLPLVLSTATALLAQRPASEAALAPAGRRDDSALVAGARERPDSVRASLARQMALAASAGTDSVGAASHLAAAHDLARAYAIAWRDSFLVRRVAAFERRPPAARAAQVAADSVRRAGNDALGRSGARAALRLWRESLRRSTAVGDSAGRAAGLGNVGAGLYEAGELDSAEAYLGRSRDLALAIGDYRTAGNALGLLGSVRKDRGDLRGAVRLYGDALAVRARAGDRRGEAADRNNLGLVAQSLGDLAGARRAFEEALALNRRHGRASAAAANLLNLGNGASGAGDYARAEALYGEALAAYQALGHRADAALVLRNIGLLETRRGDYRRGAAALRQARDGADAVGTAEDAVSVRLDLSAVQLAMGDPQAALSSLRAAERWARSGPLPPGVSAKLALAGADVAAELHDYAGADGLYTRANRLYREAGDVYGQAEVKRGHGLLLLARDQPAAALVVLTAATRTLAASGDRRAEAATRLVMGYAQRRTGDARGARRTLTAAHLAFRALGDVVGEAAALGALGDAALEAGTTTAAESLYRHGLERLREHPAPDVAWRLHAGLGEVLRARGVPAEAARELRSAVDGVERASATLRTEQRRAAYRADWLDVFAQLALVEHSRGRAGDAFAVSERMRARQMLDLLARGRLAPPRAGARGREQDLRRQIAELVRAADAAPPDGEALRGPATAGVIRGFGVAREALDAAQREYASLLLEMRDQDPAYARLVTAQSVTWRDVAARLAPDEALLEYLVTDSAGLLFVVTADTVAAYDLGAERRVLTALVDFTRGTMLRPDGRAPRPGRRWRAPLARLYRYLVSPAEEAGLLAGKRALIIVPHGDLHFLPFAALLAPGSPDRFLVERFQITYAPSASSWVRLGQRPAPPTSGGLLALAPRVDALPASRDEVASIATAYGRRATTLVAAAATEEALRAGAPGKAVVHLATFGVLNKHNPLFSYVVLAPAGADDGRLEVHEVFGLDLAARVVVLSACQTALASGSFADVPPGDDWVGLVQAFLHAGAANVAATLWPVDDIATARLMTRFHERYDPSVPDASAPAALAGAQRTMLRDPRTAHPFYWAGFVVSGGGR